MYALWILFWDFKNQISYLGSTVLYVLWDVWRNEADGASEEMWTQWQPNNVVSYVTECMPLLL
jgi:hypothetical protein